MPIIFGLDHIGKNDSLYCVQQIMKNVCKSLRGHTKIFNWLWKEKYATVNKRRVKTTPRCKKLLHLRKKNLPKGQ